MADTHGLIHGSLPTGDLYRDKAADYFIGQPLDLQGLLPEARGLRVLEFGCGSGATGSAALASGFASEYVGVELDPSAASKARNVLTRVICDNMELLDHAGLGTDWDIIVCSEILEHLVDPWAAVRRLVPLLKRGGSIFASSPNAAHFGIWLPLLAGTFTYTDAGPMDRTHLRWFTPRSYRGLFVEAGFRLVRVGPLNPLRRKAQWVNRLTGGALEHLLYTQIFVHAVRDHS